MCPNGERLAGEGSGPQPETGGRAGVEPNVSLYTLTLGGFDAQSCGTSFVLEDDLEEVHQSSTKYEVVRLRILHIKLFVLRALSTF